MEEDKKETKRSSGRPCKYDELVKPKLVLVEGWARNGLILEQIAHNLGIALGTLCEYKNKFPELDEALKRGKEEIDLIVENALLKRATGYEYDEVTQEFDSSGNLKTTKSVKKKVAPDVTAQIFWLKNRKREEWRDRSEVKQENTGEMDVNVRFVDPK